MCATLQEIHLSLGIHICGHHVCQFMSKYTKSKIGSSWRPKFSRYESCVVIVCANSVKSWSKEKLGSNIAQNHLFSRYKVIICASSCEKLTKSEIGSSLSWFKYCSKSLNMLICTIQEIHPTKHLNTLIWPLMVVKGNPRSKIIRSTERPYMWLTICVACKLLS